MIHVMWVTQSECYLKANYGLFWPLFSLFVMIAEQMKKQEETKIILNILDWIFPKVSDNKLSLRYSYLIAPWTKC